MHLEYFCRAFYLLIDYSFTAMYELVSIYFIILKIINISILRQFYFINFGNSVKKNLTKIHYEAYIILYTINT